MVYSKSSSTIKEVTETENLEVQSFLCLVNFEKLVKRHCFISQQFVVVFTKCPTRFFPWKIQLNSTDFPRVCLEFKFPLWCDYSRPFPVTSARFWLVSKRASD